MIGLGKAISPEQRLFVGVIANAAQEAAGAGRSGDAHLTIQEAARAWFRNSGDDFRTVCELAGLEPFEVRSRVLAYLERVEADPDAFVKTKRVTKHARHAGASVSDIARHTGVSATTVSNVIHDRPVSARTRARVRAAMTELGYHRHAA